MLLTYLLLLVSMFGSNVALAHVTVEVTPSVASHLQSDAKQEQNKAHRWTTSEQRSLSIQTPSSTSIKAS